jgi:hypothetical protein
MTTDDLVTALEHDLAQKGMPMPAEKPVVLARYCLQNAAVAARGAECALVACKPPAVVEAKQSARLAIESLEQALVLLGTMESANE